MVTERRTGTLIYPEHQLSPEDFLHFVETDEFCGDWDGLGFDVENDLWALQNIIMSDPAGAPVVPGTGGLRKIRFGRHGDKMGKRRGARICYAYFDRHWTVLLVMAYGKGRKDDLSEPEKHGIAQYLKRVERYLDERNY
jgi:hypothetical protein